MWLACRHVSPIISAVFGFQVEKCAQPHSVQSLRFRIPLQILSIFRYRHVLLIPHSALNFQAIPDSAKKKGPIPPFRQPETPPPLYQWEVKKFEHTYNITTESYVITFLSFSFIVFASLSYTTMFNQFVKSQRESNGLQTSIIKLFRASRFYMAFVIILSTSIFLVLPWMLFSIIVITKDIFFFKKNGGLITYIHISFVLSDIIDGVIYIFLYPPVRNSLIKIFSRNRSVLPQEVIPMETRITIVNQ